MPVVRSRPFIVVVACALLARGAASQPTQRVVIEPAAADRFVEAYRARTGLPGAAIAITRGGQVVYVAGYGTSSDGSPIGAKTQLPIASLSKSFTSLAVMQLVEAGKVVLDEPVRRYLPEFVVADPRGSAITVRQLLTHRSGMADTEFREKSVPTPTSLQDGVAMLRTIRLASDPGVAMHYHNPNYWVAARLIEVVSGESFAEYLQRHVFAPAGMRGSTTVATLDALPAVARGHIRLFGASIGLPEPDWYLQGASGVVTTAEDLAQWLIVQRNAGVAANGQRLVSAASVEQMHAGLGWSLSPEAIKHAGWLFTFTAHQALLRDSDYGLAVVTNRGLNLGPDDSAEIMAGLMAMTRGETPSVGAPLGYIVDAAMFVLIVSVCALTLRAARRSSDWARRWHDRPTVGARLSIAVWLAPVVVLGGLRSALSYLFNGRDGTWVQILYLAPSLILALAVASVLGFGVTLLRVVQVRRLRHAAPLRVPRRTAPSVAR
ncbi:MAG: hypothetical protein JWL95_1874 [Gemmatimonadetes bacterium]|nr:hypothetical protein [Gemmatimonadota bacterium]